MIPEEETKNTYAHNYVVRGDILKPPHKLVYFCLRVYMMPERLIIDCVYIVYTPTIYNLKFCHQMKDRKGLYMVLFSVYISDVILQW